MSEIPNILIFDENMDVEENDLQSVLKIDDELLPDCLLKKRSLSAKERPPRHDLNQLNASENLNIKVSRHQIDDLLLL